MEKQITRTDTAEKRQIWTEAIMRELQNREIPVSVLEFVYYYIAADDRA